MEISRRTLLLGAGVLVGVGALALLGVAGYFAVDLGPEEAALAALEDDDRVTVERMGEGTVVRSGPVTRETTGLVYYPGGRVNHESYVPTAAEIATERDVVVVVVEMPLNLAVLAPNRADDARELVPAVDSWSVGGHSLGGAMACRYAARNAADLDGLVLHAAYCDRDVSTAELRVLSVLGDADGVLNVERERESRSNLPEDARVVELSGVNHAGFGAYGVQPGDEPAPRDGAAMRADVGRVTGDWLVADEDAVERDEN